MSKNFEEMSEKDWKSKLTDEQYRSLRLKGTDYPFTGEYLNNQDVTLQYLNLILSMIQGAVGRVLTVL